MHFEPLSLSILISPNGLPFVSSYSYSTLAQLYTASLPFFSLFLPLDSSSVGSLTASCLFIPSAPTLPTKGTRTSTNGCTWRLQRHPPLPNAGFGPAHLFSLPQSQECKPTYTALAKGGGYLCRVQRHLVEEASRKLTFFSHLRFQETQFSIGGDSILQTARPVDAENYSLVNPMLYTSIGWLREILAP
jgi:hypothetical protein